MKKTLLMSSIPFLLTVMPTLAFSEPDMKPSEETMTELTKSEIQKLSHALGYMTAENMEKQNLNLDLSSYIKGVQDAMAGKAAPMEQEQIFEMVQRHQKNIQGKQSKENLKKAEDFLKSNKTKTGVTTLEAGKLQYQVLSPGKGDVVSKTSTPLIHYEGKVLDGEVFDSSYKRGTPIPMNLESTIPGFTVGVAGMKQGEKRRLYIHPELGYGDQAGRIPPNSLLIFDIEVVEPEVSKTDAMSK